MNLLICSEDNFNYKFIFTALEKINILLADHCWEIKMNLYDIWNGFLRVISVEFTVSEN